LDVANQLMTHFGCPKTSWGFAPKRSLCFAGDFWAFQKAIFQVSQWTIGNHVVMYSISNDIIGNQ